MQWWYGDQGRQQGPVGVDELRAMVAAGQLGPQTMVWREGLPAWQPLTAFPELCGGYPGMAGYGAPVAPTSGLAIASLVCGIVSLFLCYVHAVAAVPAVVCGHLAIKRIRDSVVPTGGRGLAVAGLVTGYLGVLAQLGTLVFVGIFFFSMSKAVTSPRFITPVSPPSVSPATPVPAPAAPESGPGGVEVKPGPVEENLPEEEPAVDEP